MSARLDRLFRPRSIAVIGGGAWCANVVKQCRAMGFSGPVWAVHPSKPEIGGAPACASVAALPGVPDAAFVGVNRQAAIEVVRDLAAAGAGGAVCFAAGFAEAEAETGDGRSLQAALVDAAADMPILGPNCYGFINYLDGALLWPDQQGGQRCESGVAIVTQSSNIAINMTMQARALPLAYVVTAGNQAQTGLAAVGAGLLDDARVTALGLHIEGIGDLSAFEGLAARARARGKPVIVLKVGASEAARAATVSHTASLAGSEIGADALFARLGMGRARTVTGFLEALKLVHIAGSPASTDIASMSCSGGEASLVADLAGARGLVFPALDQAQTAALRAELGPKVRLSNPLDYNTYIWPDTDRMSAVFTAMMRGSADFGLVVLDFPRGDRCSDADWAHVVAAVERARQAAGKPMAILASMPENLPEEWAADIARRGIVPLAGLAEGLEAVAAAAAAHGRPFAPVMKPRPVARLRVLPEDEAKTLLGGFGLPVPRRARARTPEEAGQAGQAIGFPVVVKGVGHAHKTEAGAVRLGLVGPDQVRQAAREIGGSDWLVEQMITDGVAELLVGVTTDPAHGVMLTLGAGGWLTEIIADTVTLLVPAGADEIGAALDRLRIARMLGGYRGRPAADRGAIVKAVLALQDAVMASGGAIVEAEVNPLIARPDGAVAVDALVRMEET